MNKIIKRIIIITIILISTLYIKVKATNETNITINPSQEMLEPGQSINIKLDIDNISIPTSNVRLEFKYNKNIFEQITDESFNKIRAWNLPTLYIFEDKEDDTAYYVSVFIDRSVDTTTPRTILDFDLKVRENITNLDNAYISVQYLEASSSDGVDIIKEEKNERYTFKYEDVNPEKLYLTTKKYKIGKNNTENYEDGDDSIYRISPNTKISDFINSNNLSTNGNISVYNANGEEEANLDELVKTGMILKVTKEGYSDIELKISVIGDLNGDGESDITDLIEIRRHIQNIEYIIGIYTKSGDINEDMDIDITDIIKIRRHIQKIDIF